MQGLNASEKSVLLSSALTSDSASEPKKIFLLTVNIQVTTYMLEEKKVQFKVFLIPIFTRLPYLKKNK